MQIKSVFDNGEKIPVKYTTDGVNVNPPLEITDIPNGAKTIVLIVDDPDAQRVVGYTWVHWIRYNIPVYEDNLKIEENSLPGIEGLSTYKYEKYGGPNPPKGSGIHRYYFKIYALNSNLNLKMGTNLKELEKAMEEHIIDKAELIGIYGRD